MAVVPLRGQSEGHHTSANRCITYSISPEMNDESIEPSLSGPSDHENDLSALASIPSERSTRIVDEEMVLTQVEALIRMVLSKPPPSSKTSDPDWLRLFRFCEKHRELLGDRVRSRKKDADPGPLDLWLRQLASPPPGMWGGVRLGMLPLIRAAGIPPRSEYEPMFTDSSLRTSGDDHIMRIPVGPGDEALV